ncbi:TetR/AcrR family transcriptional regulator [Leucobacter rhizosphaerae]|uniref:TetR/AcrR family transcriptional regulator n=1 Tax=Leucobacter rhizosphaerae TaxID=2932245 RepID=A0ABY4FV41_9MICO|nr:TetR/AcrR family transcriptional regulator [Leucobacter rhizosphaerae]UOQ60169.1 TetR/AcrR family transcriptional regulator [Leucobacter rhizosphaerae]
MSSTRGRPHASSHAMLADAACELFLEQGYEATSVTEITRRTGVSRSSFFNYFSSKSAILWFVLDAQIDALAAALEDPATPVDDALAAFGGGPVPETLALAIVEARTMRVEEELALGRAVRQLRIADLVAQRLERDGTASIRAQITAGAIAAALIASVWRWAGLGAGRHRLEAQVADGLAEVAALLR